MTLQALLELGFLGLIAYFMSDAVGTIKELKDSVNLLNIKIAVIVEQLQSHDKRIEKLESH